VEDNMSRCLAILSALGLLLCCAAVGISAVTPESIKADEHLLEEGKTATDAASLLDYFRRRTLHDTEKAKIAALIRKLGDDSYEERELASTTLIAVGPPALTFLRDALKSDDLEVVKRSQTAIELIEKSSTPESIRAAARVLAYRKPAEAAATLLAYLPFADDPSVADEVSQAVVAVAVRDGKPDPVVVKALEDKLPVKRATAAEALVQLKDQRPAIRKLLKDPEPLVRMRAGLALVEVKEKEPIPILIALLTEKPKLETGPIEDLLYLLAGEKAPTIDTGTDDAGRRKYRDAWDKWWRDEGKGLDLAKFDPEKRQLGRTMVCTMDARGLTGRVYEVDRSGKLLWQIENLNYPIDAQVIGDDRVLIAEYRTRNVTERNFKGEILWTKNVGSLLLGARRQPNGHTFIVTRNQLLEVDKDGKELVTIARGNDVGAAAQARDGTIALVTTGGMFIRYDRTGKELKSFKVAGPVLYLGSNIDLLPGGHVLIPIYSANKIVEYDADGKEVWEAKVNLPGSVMRLPNGNTLVSSRTGTTVSEIDRTGKEVWTHRIDNGRPMRARRR
jgi:hypothetical protein